MRRHIDFFGVVSVGVLAAVAAAYTWLDGPAAAWFYANKDSQLGGAAKWLSKLGQSEWYLVPAALLFVWYRYRGRLQQARAAGYVFLSVALSGIACIILKVMLGRPRPGVFFEEGLSGFHWLEFDSSFLSFPSGHATTAIAAAVALGVVYRPWRWPICAAGALIAMARVVSTSHYPSDIIAGAWLGCAVALACYVWLYADRKEVATDAREPLAGTGTALRRRAADVLRQSRRDAAIR